MLAFWRVSSEWSLNISILKIKVAITKSRISVRSHIFQTKTGTKGDQSGHM